jgi:hypothetical protein
LGLNFGVRDKCVADAEKAAHNQEQAEADLYAQRQMAVWAFAVGMSGLVSIPLSLAGILFVWRSLALNREALRIAGEANANTLTAIEQEQANAQKGLRAYLGVVFIHFDCPSSIILDYKPREIIAGQKITDFAVLTIKNFGQTPANKVYTWVNWFAVSFPESLPLNFSYPDVAAQLPPGVEISLVET